MNIGLAIDKKNGVDNRTGVIKTDGKATDSNSGCYNMNNGKDTMKREYEERIAQNEWNGWGTALKPSFEPIIVARKPLDGTCVNNVIKWGVGGINIDECRVGNEEISYFPTNLGEAHGNKFGNGAYMPKDTSKPPITHTGRFPANTILTYDETDYDEVCGGFPNSGSGNNGKPYNYAGREYDNKDTSMFNGDKPQAPSNYNDSGSACRYFYNAKASKKDRNDGIKNNNHPCVKPTSLMQYLVRLVTKMGGAILDPFMGSGSTGKAVAYENNERNANYKFIGIEMSKEYCDIAKARIEYAINDKGAE